MSIALQSNYTGIRVYLMQWLCLSLLIIISNFLPSNMPFIIMQTIFLVPMIALETKYNQVFKLSKTINSAYLCFSVDLLFGSILGATWLCLMWAREIYVMHKFFNQSSPLSPFLKALGVTASQLIIPELMYFFAKIGLKVLII